MGKISKLRQIRHLNRPITTAKKDSKHTQHVEVDKLYNFESTEVLFTQINSAFRQYAIVILKIFMIYVLIFSFFS